MYRTIEILGQMHMQGKIERILHVGSATHKSIFKTIYIFKYPTSTRPMTIGGENTEEVIFKLKKP